MIKYLSAAKFAVLVCLPVFSFAQSFGPNNPTSGANNSSTGTNAWTTPAAIISSNDAYATDAVKGISQSLEGKGFGFNLSGTDNVTGIQLDIEKATKNVLNVEMVDAAWTVGTARPALGAGQNRCLIVIIGFENSTPRDISSVTYGGRAMTQLTDIGVGSPVFYGKTEAWYLLESDLILTSGTTISYTFATSIPAENFEIVGSALYKNVDQFAPFFDTETVSSTTSTTTLQFGSTLNYIPGSVTIGGIFCGNPPNSTTARGNCSGFTVNSGFSELVDYHDFNNSFASSGGVLSVAQLFNSGIGTTNPTFTFNGTPNRRVLVGFTMRRARNWDNTVHILKGGIATSANLAQTNVEWPTTDTYTTYGGAGTLWGTTWDFSMINDANFGGEISAFVQNATAALDHMRISIYTYSSLPVKLISFTATQNNREVYLNWQSASETNLDYYQIERSMDGIHFELMGAPVHANGNTVNLSSYSTVDANPNSGMNYYRLKSVDFDGSIEYSDLKPVLIADNKEEMVFPNPTDNWAVLSTTSVFDEVIIMDQSGRIIDRIAGTEIPADVQLNLNEENDGVYLVCIKRGNETTVKRLTKSSRALN